MPTQAVMMTNGLMWVFTGDSHAAVMEEFRAQEERVEVRGCSLVPPPQLPLCSRWGLDVEREGEEWWLGEMMRTQLGTA